jgi:hypothetical protein
MVNELYLAKPKNVYVTGRHHQQYEGKVDGGVVKARLGVRAVEAPEDAQLTPEEAKKAGKYYKGSSKNFKQDANFTNAFALKYEGAHADSAHWVQFVWRERQILGQGNAVEERMDGEVDGSGGSYRLTTDPAKPNINVDAGKGSVTPYYEEKGGAVRRPGSIQILDQPHSKETDTTATMLLRSQPTKKLRSVWHFDTFLLRQKKVIYHVGIVVTETWVMGERGAEEEKKDQHKLTSGGGVSALPKPFADALQKRFPDFGGKSNG